MNRETQIGKSRLTSKIEIAMFANFIAIGLMAFFYNHFIVEHNHAMKIDMVFENQDVQNAPAKSTPQEPKILFVGEQNSDASNRITIYSVSAEKVRFQTVFHHAIELGVEGLSYDVEIGVAHEAAADLETEYFNYKNKIVEIENAIRKNNRTVVIGSSTEEIDKAIRLCKIYSEECVRSWYDDELERSVSLQPFTLDATEVSVSQFRQFIKRHEYVTDAERRGSSYRVDLPYEDYAVVGVSGLSWRNTYLGNSDDYPVVHVTLRDAEAYCKSIDKRLPTESEWEYVASGFAGFKYPWGEQWKDSNVNLSSVDDSEVLRVTASFPATEFVHFDLAGGVSEWTSTRNNSRRAAYIKGASRFDVNVANARVAVRRLESIDYSGEDVGFRCVEDSEFWPVKANNLARMP